MQLKESLVKWLDEEASEVCDTSFHSLLQCCKYPVLGFLRWLVCPKSAGPSVASAYRIAGGGWGAFHSSGARVIPWPKLVVP